MTGTGGLDWPFAQAWAEQGFVVMPGARLRNIPHPMLGSGWNYEEIGSTDPEWIRRCWDPDTGDPAANVLVVTGHRSRLLVLDLDRRNGTSGMASLLAWMDTTGRELPEAPMVRTPSGGFHLFYSLDADAPRYRKVGWLPGVDALGGGGQVPVWPSLRSVPVVDRKTGKTDDVLVEYEFIIGSLETLRTDMPPAPPWLLDDIQRRPATVTSTDGSSHRALVSLPPTEVLLDTGLPLGRRDDWANQLACRLWRVHGDDEASVRDVMERVIARTPRLPGETWGPTELGRWTDKKLDRARSWVERQRADEHRSMRSYRP